MPENSSTYPRLFQLPFQRVATGVKRKFPKTLQATSYSFRKNSVSLSGQSNLISFASYLRTQFFMREISPRRTHKFKYRVRFLMGSDFDI